MVEALLNNFEGWTNIHAEKKLCVYTDKERKKGKKIGRKTEGRKEKRKIDREKEIKT